MQYIVGLSLWKNCQKIYISVTSVSIPHDSIADHLNSGLISILFLYSITHGAEFPKKGNIRQFSRIYG